MITATAPRLAALGIALGASVIAASALADAPSNAGCPGGMLLVPGGTFAMGDLEGFPDEKPLRQATVQAFCLDATEVTVAAYAACAREGLCTPAHPHPEWSTLKSREMKRWSDFCNADRVDRLTHPVNCVVWDQGARYCAARGFRLPTEVEWEYAARGGAEAREFPWGNAPPNGAQANLCGSECEPPIAAIRGAWGALYPADDGWVATAPVGSFPSGDARWGHHDLTGNVCEWVSGAYCPYDQPDCGDEASPMCRGNHFLANNFKKARPARRNRDDARHRGPDVGFRCAVDLEITTRHAPLTDHVTALPELPSSPRVAIVGFVALLVGLAIAGSGGAATALLVAILIFAAELDPRTSITTGFVAAAATYAAALVSPALRKRVSTPIARPLALGAFAGALGAGALGGLLPDRVQLIVIVAAMIASAAQIALNSRRSASDSDAVSASASPSLTRASAGLGALGGLLGFSPGSLQVGLLRRLTALPAAEAAATAIPALLAMALGGGLGRALHARPDLGLGVVMACSAAIGALLRGLLPSRERSRAGQIALALALLALGLLVFAREVLPATVFPNL